jgi:hypothetical protein
MKASETAHFKRLAAKLIVVCGLGDFFEPHGDGSAITR